MAFWGVEVRPGKPYTHVYDKTRGRLRISQATLGSSGNGKGASKSVVQCNVGKKSPILLCSLAPDQTETCHLELEFEEDDDVVFSVLGQRSVHLSGYYLSSSHIAGRDGDETDSYGEDIGEDDSESFGTHSSDDDEYESDFIDDGDVEMFSSPKRKSSVVIEEIVEDDKPANGTGSRRQLRKKSQLIDSDADNDTSERQQETGSQRRLRKKSQLIDGDTDNDTSEQQQGTGNRRRSRKKGQLIDSDDDNDTSERQQGTGSRRRSRKKSQLIDSDDDNDTAERQQGTGSRLRLRKKSQLIDSDDDNDTSERQGTGSRRRSRKKSQLIDSEDDNDTAERQQGTGSRLRLRKKSQSIDSDDDNDTSDLQQGTGSRQRLRKKSQLIDSDDDNDTSERKLVVKSNNTTVVESEDEDGFPISLQVRAEENIEGNKKASNKTIDERKRKADALSHHNGSERDASLASDVVPEAKDTMRKKKLKDNKTAELSNIAQGQHTDNRDGRVANTEGNNHLIGGVDVAENDGKLKKKKDKIRKGKITDIVDHEMKSTEEVKGDEKEVPDTGSMDKKDPSEAEKSTNDVDGSSGGKRKKKKKKKVKEDVTATTEVVEEPRKDEAPNDNGLAKKSIKKAKKGKSSDKDTNLEESLEVEGKEEPHKTRTFSNGLTIEELSLGKPDGKKASPGSKVSVNYIGKLKDGNFFDSNVGEKPFKFRLGFGHVIKGWDVGIAGMRIGDKRRLVIPPSMGYGDANVGKVPANSWLVFDMELVGVD